ncbi:MAG: hypothetical protein AAF384_12945 [Pseudomonadota bacterium]
MRALRSWVASTLVLAAISGVGVSPIAANAMDVPAQWNGTITNRTGPFAFLLYPPGTSMAVDSTWTLNGTTVVSALFSISIGISTLTGQTVFGCGSVGTASCPLPMAPTDPPSIPMTQTPGATSWTLAPNGLPSGGSGSFNGVLLWPISGANGSAATMTITGGPNSVMSLTINGGVGVGTLTAVGEWSGGVEPPDPLDPEPPATEVPIPFTALVLQAAVLLGVGLQRKLTS